MPDFSLNSLQISRLQPADAKEIHAIARSHQFKPNLPTSHQNGFLVFVKSIPQYRKLIQQSSFSHKTVHNGQIAGYIFAYSWSDLTRLKRETEPEIASLIKSVPNPHQLVYIEQIASRKKFTRLGIAQQLLNHLQKKSPSKTLGAAIVNKPHRNQASYNFFVHKNAWHQIGIIIRENIQAIIITSN